MVGLLEHLARYEDGVPHPLHIGDAARAQLVAQHEAGIHLAESVDVRRGAGARVEGRVVFEDAGGRTDRIGRASASSKKLRGLRDRALNAGYRSSMGLLSPGSRAAMYDDGPSCSQPSLLQERSPDEAGRPS